MSGDRRKFVREGCLISAHLRVGTRIYEGTLVNISEQGAFFATRLPVETGSAVQIRFRHPWTDEAVTAAGVVMRRSQGGDGLGPQNGVALALLDSLSDLEDTDANVSLSDSLVPGSMSTLRKLRSRARTDEARRSGSHPTIEVESGPHPIPSGLSPRPPIRTGARTCTFEGTGRSPTAGDLQSLSSGGFAVLTADPPDRGRLVRVEIDPPDSNTFPTRIAGKVTWSSATDTDARAEGFGIHILHFLSSADERRYQDILLSERLRG